jgi:serine/threonine protein phosphatase PrpC
MMPREADSTSDPATTPYARAVLLGRDHEAAGAVATAVATSGVAVGLARGWQPKPYAYVDPNEDAVACAVGPSAHLLVVADGHKGHRASHAAVTAVLDLLGGDPRPADLSEQELITAAGLIEERIALVNRGRSPRSRTTLVVALRTAAGLQWFGAGDSALMVVDPDGPRVLAAATRWFFGGGASRTALHHSLARGRIELGADTWVVLATDGYTDYVPRGLTPPLGAARAVAGADAAEHAVGALLDQARRGGAGDNVGVSVSGPWYKRVDGYDHHFGHHG